MVVTASAQVSSVPLPLPGRLHSHICPRPSERHHYCFFYYYLFFQSIPSLLSFFPEHSFFVIFFSEHSVFRKFVGSFPKCPREVYDALRLVEVRVSLLSFSLFFSSLPSGVGSVLLFSLFSFLFRFLCFLFLAFSSSLCPDVG